MVLANPFAMLCIPSQFFLILTFIDVIYISFFQKSKKNIPVRSRSIIFFFISMCTIGWSFVINYGCGYAENVGWVLAAIPISYVFFKKLA